jgi:FixJ family two-component response regulator
MIVVTAQRIDEKIQDRLSKLKIVDWVEKPFSTKALLASVQKALEVSNNISCLPNFVERIKGFVARQEATRHRAAGIS